MATDKVVGIFVSQEEAIRAIKRLKSSGYEDIQISVLAKHHEDVDKLKDQTDVSISTEDSNKAAFGGAVTGGALGGLAALLLDLGLISIPGLGPFLVAGPIATSLTGALAGGAVGSVVGALVDLGLTKDEAEEYEQYIERGDILLMVDDHLQGEVYRNFYENNSVIRGTYDFTKKN